MPPAKKLVGKPFGRLVVIKRVGTKKRIRGLKNGDT